MRLLCWLGWHSWGNWHIPFEFKFAWFQNRKCQVCGIMKQRKLGHAPEARRHTTDS